MEYKSSEVKAGLLIFLGFCALAVFVFSLGGVKSYFTPKRDLLIVFDYTGGLEVGAKVRYAGLDVGRVKSINISNQAEDIGADRVLVTAEIDPKIHLRQDARASIKTEGLMGAFYIDIRPGNPKSPILPVDQPLQGIESFEFTEVGDMVEEAVVQLKRFTNLTEDLVNDARGTLQQAQTTLNNIDSMVLENRPAVTSSLSSLHRAASDLAELINANKEEIAQTIKSAHATTDNARRILGEKGGDLRAIIDQVQRASRELELLLADNRPALTELVRRLDTETEKLSKDLSSAAARFDDTMHQGNAILVENRRDLRATLKNLKTVSDNLKQITDEIKRNPWKLVRKTDEVLPKPPAPRPGKGSSLRLDRLDKVPVD